MPEIGDQLRETRMRNRIDITEVEAATKIRAKYLRALENEEWDLLPGPTFVKTFLRTYADYLGLDARNLVEEYRARYERPAVQELAPFGTSLGGRRARPRRAVFAPWMAVVLGVIALVAVLFLLGKWGGDPDEQEAGAPAVTPEPTTAPAGDDGQERKRKPARRRNVRLQILPTGPVSVCVENGDGEPLIANLTLDAGQSSETFKARRFRMSFGTGAAVMRIDGREYPVSDDAPVGYEVRAGGKPRTLADAERPDCAG
ncbi:MAG TPA: helix-turn-helix domain-containing protein [Solirubrobacteraceae bacterium]|nr:helix-turn-helix domain-containing protein [Solirubrobacteraceae bacterium]